MDLRPYQLAAIASARKEIQRGAKRVLITAPTGSGKTVIGADIIRSADARGSRVAFLAHRRELIQQTSEKLLRFGVRHGVLTGEMKRGLHHNVLVASVQTLARRLHEVPRFNVLFLDEAHHSMAGQYQQILGAFPDAITIGLTATPWRLDGKGLGDLFDGHVLAETPRGLRDLGFLAPVGGWEYEAIDTRGARVKGGDFVVGDLAAAAGSRRVVGDIVSEYQLHAAGRRAILFATSVEHSRQMAAEFVKAGVTAEHIDGEMPVAERDAALARLRSGATLVVCNCNVLTEGFDCPELEVGILARPTLSTVLALQMIGRILRTAPGKTLARIHDHAGILAAHGHPYAERDYSPEKSSGATRRDVEERKAKPPKRCASCKSFIARWPCDACGYSPSPTELKLHVEAARNEITNEEVIKSEKQREEMERRRGFWRQRDEQWKYEFFLRMVAKHGPSKAKGVYRWFSGELEWPSRSWDVGAGRMVSA